MVVKEYIDWQDAPRWSARVQLGSNGVFYKLLADWNSRQEFWSVSIFTLDDIAVIAGKKMVLKSDLLIYCKLSELQDCYLAPFANSESIDKITYDNMINGEVKLYNIIG